MLNSHTHCQAAPANAKTKASQRMCLPNRTDEKETTKAQQCICDYVPAAGATQTHSAYTRRWLQCNKILKTKVIWKRKTFTK